MVRRYRAHSDVLGKLHDRQPGSRPGQENRFALLFSGFRSNLPALLRQGGLYLAGALAILGLSALVDGGLLLQLMVLGEKPPASAFEDGSFGRRGDAGGHPLRAGAGRILVRARSLGVARPARPCRRCSTAFSAALRNWRAFLAYGLALVPAEA